MAHISTGTILPIQDRRTSPVVWSLLTGATSVLLWAAFGVLLLRS